MVVDGRFALKHPFQMQRPTDCKEPQICPRKNLTFLLLNP